MFLIVSQILTWRIDLKLLSSSSLVCNQQRRLVSKHSSNPLARRRGWQYTDGVLTHKMVYSGLVMEGADSWTQFCQGQLEMLL
jgi:hypothetical protein